MLNKSIAQSLAFFVIFMLSARGHAAQNIEIFDTQNPSQDDPFDPTCADYAKRQASKARIEQATENIRLHDEIMQRCYEQAPGSFSNHLQVTADLMFQYSGLFSIGFNEGIQFKQTMAKEAAERFHHVALTEKAYKLLNYPGIDQTLKECFPNSPKSQADVKLGIILDDTLPENIGRVSGVLMGGYIVKTVGGFIKGLTWVPAKAAMATKGLSETSIKAIGWGLVAPFIGLGAYFGFTVHQKSALEKVPTEEANRESVQQVETPDKVVEKNYQSCIRNLNMARSSSATRALQEAVALRNCEIFIRNSTFSLSELKLDEVRCRPENFGAYERIEKRLRDYASAQYEYLDFLRNQKPHNN